MPLWRSGRALRSIFCSYLAKGCRYNPSCKTMKKTLVLITSLIIFSCTTNQTIETPDEPITETPFFIKGADLSFLHEIEAENTLFYNQNNQEENAVDILKANGINTIRLRVWHTPATTHSSLTEVANFAQQLKAKGLKIWLSVHYSDTWADPSQQQKPVAWETLSQNQLETEVYNYTSLLCNQIAPEYIQIGNETNNGLLFPNGNRYQNFNQYKSLLQKGIEAVRNSNIDTNIMLHFAGIDGAETYFNELQSLDYDTAALSYYPIWHGTNLTEVQTTLSTLKNTLNKDVVIAETAYPFTLDWNDYTNNIIGLQNQLIPNYPASLQGQTAFLAQLQQICKNANTIGLSYWAPDWVAYRGPTASNGSSWENQTLFDFSNKVTPAASVFLD